MANPELRITRTQMLMDIARTVSKRGTCQRKQVGAVIARDGRIVSIGYNGAPRGLAHCSPGHCDIHAPCSWATHAELNAITTAAREGIRLKGTEIFNTDAPCPTCARAIINAGIVHVHYAIGYRDPTGLELLDLAGIPYTHEES